MANIKLKKIKIKIRKYIRLSKELKKDKKCPKISKVLLVIAISYFFLPFDLIPDFIPFFGQLDDMIIIPVLIYFAIRFIPKDVFLKHYNKIFNNKKKEDLNN